MRSTTIIVLQRPSVLEQISVDFVEPRIVKRVKWNYFVIIDHCMRFIVACPTKVAKAEAAVECLQRVWVPVLGAPKVIFYDNGFTFGGEFKWYVVNDLIARLVHTSLYYPQGNAINEASHQRLEHMLKCECHLGEEDFPVILSRAVASYNASYLSAISDAPFAALFGKPPILPGFQSLLITCPEELKIGTLLDKEQRRCLVALQQVNDGKREENKLIEVGMFVLFPLGLREKRSQAHGLGISVKYLASWSLPSKVLEVNDKQLKIVEYATGSERLVLKNIVRVLPREVTSILQPINWDNINYGLPQCCKTRPEINILENIVPLLFSCSESSSVAHRTKMINSGLEDALEVADAYKKKRKR